VDPVLTIFLFFLVTVHKATHMSRFPRTRRAWLTLSGLLIIFVLGFLATSENAAIWPVRNTLFYHAMRWWASNVGAPQPAGVGALYGCVRGAGGQALPGATVSVAERDGA
jgi:hypothetical protein